MTMLTLAQETNTLLLYSRSLWFSSEGSLEVKSVMIYLSTISNLRSGQKSHVILKGLVLDQGCLCACMASKLLFLGAKTKRTID